MERHIKAAEIFANLLDNQFEIFGIRFGITAILDIIPEIGDIAAAILSLYIVWIAVKAEVPPIRIVQMLFNISINLILGLIPVIGDVTYIIHKANLQNVKLLKKYTATNIIEGEVVK